MQGRALHLSPQVIGERAEVKRMSPHPIVSSKAHMALCFLPRFCCACRCHFCDGPWCASELSQGERRHRAAVCPFCLDWVYPPLHRRHFRHSKYYSTPHPTSTPKYQQPARCLDFWLRVSGAFLVGFYSRNFSTIKITVFRKIWSRRVLKCSLRSHPSTQIGLCPIWVLWFPVNCMVQHL